MQQLPIRPHPPPTTPVLLRAREQGLGLDVPEMEALVKDAPLLNCHVCPFETAALPAMRAHVAGHGGRGRSE